ncbi:hypothetical protein EVAR_42988_1 [Eumeta japonica]|uniref:Uncharacterized protein n=1 Tax=Eumeta variegata TaxID=151549 RepID=A0A4C1WA52_EUMVA|nr:hypothetical protein EVAR_42988_1 [Eumeta japonica]
MSNVETKRLRMNHTNIQKQTLKALHQAKKTENGRQMEETCPFLLYLLTHYSIYYPSLIQFLTKGFRSDSAHVDIELISTSFISTNHALDYNTYNTNFVLGFNSNPSPAFDSDSICYLGAIQ